MAFKILAVTNQGLCAEPLAERVAALCDAGIDEVIVREKELSEDDYAGLLQLIFDTIAPDQHDLICVNSFVDIAEVRGILSVQLSFEQFRSHPDFAREFPSVGVSVHSVAEALEAERLGAHYLIAGHIFATDCKPGAEPRGLDFLREVCDATGIPVYAIGGVSANNIASVQKAGADGACLMSTLMTCKDVAAELKRLRVAAQAS